jgi:hypothetical protein
MDNTPLRLPADAPRATTAGLDSVAIARLMEEVRNDTDRQPSIYNRVHNRHNR